MRTLLFTWVVGIGMFATLPGALASCAEPLPLEEAFDQTPAVFVGTVEAVEFQGRLAHVAVDGVWKGDVAAEVRVQGTDTLDPNMMTSIDRTYQVGTIYVFFVNPGGVGFTDNGCTNTAVAEADLMAKLDTLNGAAATAPIATDTTTVPEDTGTAMGWIAGGILGVIGLAGIAGAMRMRRARSLPEIEGFSAAQPTEQRRSQS